MKRRAMTKKSNVQLDRESKQQVAAFRKAARELGADESKERFQDALRKIAKQKTPRETAERKPD